MSNIFDRTRMLIGDNGIEKLNNANVIIFGVGGVGGYVLEALVRSGITHITIVDNDDISETNINRQILAKSSTIGKRKVEVAKDRAIDINQNCEVTIIDKFYNQDNKDEFKLESYDYIVDAIDTVSSKILLIKEAKEKNIKIISSMGTGNKMDPEKLTITDIYKTNNCPLARTIRKLCKENNIKDLKVVYSTEDPIIKNTFSENGRNVPGSISFVPATAGMLIASVVVKDIISE